MYKDKALQRKTTRERVRRYRARIRLGLTRSWSSHQRKTSYRKGYRYIWLDLESPFRKMANAYGFVAEHRLIIAKRLNRPLQVWEIVHHINKVKDDNRDENLYLVSGERHHQLTLLENRINYLEKRLTLLEAENILLRGSNKVVYQRDYMRQRRKQKGVTQRRYI